MSGLSVSASITNFSADRAVPAAPEKLRHPGRATLASWYLHIAVCVAILAAVLLPALSVQADAVDLTITISGNSSGQGLHTLSFSGEVIRVNVSQENETSWNVTADGGQHDDV
jgi:hypothetical protein